jgi:hypothetical protein
LISQRQHAIRSQRIENDVDDGLQRIGIGGGWVYISRGLSGCHCCTRTGRLLDLLLLVISAAEIVDAHDEYDQQR